MSVPDDSVPWTDPKSARLIYLNGPQVLIIFHPVIDAAFDMLTQILGDNIATPPLIETNAQALRTRHRPRVQIVYEKHFHSATLANRISFQDLRLWMLPTTNLELAFKLYLTIIAFLQISYLSV